MSTFALVVQALCHADFSASPFCLAAEAPGGILGLLGLIGAAITHYLQAKRNAK